MQVRHQWTMHRLEPQGRPSYYRPVPIGRRLSPSRKRAVAGCDARGPRRQDRRCVRRSASTGNCALMARRHCVLHLLDSADDDTSFSAWSQLPLCGHFLPDPRGVDTLLHLLASLTRSPSGQRARSFSIRCLRHSGYDRGGSFPSQPIRDVATSTRSTHLYWRPHSTGRLSAPLRHHLAPVIYRRSLSHYMG